MVNYAQVGRLAFGGLGLLGRRGLQVEVFLWNREDLLEGFLELVKGRRRHDLPTLSWRRPSYKGSWGVQ